MSETLLIGIGAQKAGTTWLSDYLRASQPRVHQTPMKEVHFFDNYFMPQYGAYFEEQRLAAFKRSVNSMNVASIGEPKNAQALIDHLCRFQAIRSPERYLEFMRRGAGDKDILCDITPDYALLDSRGFDVMRAILPNVKVVFLLRNPADRLWSSLRFNKTHNPAFDIEANFEPFLARQDFARFADYERTIGSVLTHFDPEKVHLEFYENLFTDAAIKRFCLWLGLPFISGDYGARSNAALVSDMPDDKRRRAVQAYAQTYRDIHARFGEALPPNWIADMDM